MYQQKNIRKTKGPQWTTFKSDITKVPLFFLIFTRWYLKLRFVFNNFWEKIIKSSHCVVLRKGQWTRLSQKKNDATKSTLCQNKKVIHNPYISLLISFFAIEKENAAWKIVWNPKLYNFGEIQRYTYRVLQTIQMKLIVLCVWAERAILGSAKTAWKFRYEIQIG